MSEVSNNEVVAETVESVESVSLLSEDKKEASWLDSMPEEFKSNPNLAKFKSIDELAKSYLNQTSLLGKKVAEFAAEDISKLYDKMGRPESADKYEFEGEIDEAIKKEFAEIAYNSGLTKEQAAKMIAEYSKAKSAAKANDDLEMDKVRLEWKESLSKEFGARLNEELTIAKKAFNKLADEDLKKFLSDTGLHENPNMIKLFSKLGKSYLQEDVVAASNGAASFAMTAEDAKAEIARKLSNAEFKAAYMTAHHAGHKHAVEELQKLYAIASK